MGVWYMTRLSSVLRKLSNAISELVVFGFGVSESKKNETGGPQMKFFDSPHLKGKLNIWNYWTKKLYVYVYFCEWGDTDEHLAGRNTLERQLSFFHKNLYCTNFSSLSQERTIVLD